MQFAKLTKNFVAVIILYCNRAFKGDEVHLWGGGREGCEPKYYEATYEASAYTEWRKKNACFFFIYLPAISFFGVTSNQKSTFENLVQSTI